MLGVPQPPLAWAPFLCPVVAPSAPHTLTPPTRGALLRALLCSHPRRLLPAPVLPDPSGIPLFSSRFSNLGVLHVTKKNMMEIMKEKLKQQKMRNRTHLLTGEGSLGARWDSVPPGSGGGRAGAPGARSPCPA